MAITTTIIQYVIVITIIMISLNGIGMALDLNVVSVPDNIDTSLENITQTSTLMYDSQTRMERTSTLMYDSQTQMELTSTLMYDSQTRIEHTLDQVGSALTRIANTQTQIVNILQELSEQMNTQNQLISLHGIPRDCSDLAVREQYPSGSYTIRPWEDLGNLRVYCDMDTDNGGWTVFQRRFDGSVDFYRGWDDYEEGFGSPDGEYWLGLRHLRRLTQQGTWELRVDLQDFSDDTVYAEYGSFSVGDAASNYRLSIGAYSGTAGDSLLLHNNYPFSTHDRDNDGHSGNCAELRQGAWWYYACASSNLNGLQGSTSFERLIHKASKTGMIWYRWKSSYEVLKRSEMKIRRIQ